MDTIVALGTPNGRSAIGVIRLSGDESLEIVRTLIDDPQFSPQSAHAILRSLKFPESSEILDRALVTFFQSPNSYTGEDVVEISCHGSPLILRQIIDLALAAGGRLAGPGEFTLRALRNGKLNLTQAEAIRDLIDAQTDAAAQQAARQVAGELSLRLQETEQRLVRVIVQLESALEFVEDDLPQIQKEILAKDLRKIVDEIGTLASTFDVGHLLRDGLRVTIIGRPNVGKSSLFNRLLALDRAIVTELPGTTRDTLTEPISIAGVPILLTDTAGVRDSVDRIESIGVERSRQAMADADLVVVVLDGSADLVDEDFAVLDAVEEIPHIVAVNKCDLKSTGTEVESILATDLSRVAVSAVTGCGLARLRAAILEPFSFCESATAGLLVTNARQHDLLRRTEKEIQASAELLVGGAGEEIVVLGLHNGLRFLGEITGETTTEELLSEIFATFCIGK